MTKRESQNLDPPVIYMINCAPLQYGNGDK